MSNRINDAAHALLHRRTEQQPALLDAATAPQDLVEAYAVHTALLALLTDSGAGAQIGWKVGFTNDAAQARHGATEPVFAGLFSFLLIGEVLGLKQVLGCLLILAGMVVAEVSSKARDGRDSRDARDRGSGETGRHRLCSWGLLMELTYGVLSLWILSI